MSHLNQHPLSAAFPSMSPEEREALRKDIEAHGLRNPVVTFEGQVLDGWHRYQACLESGRDPVVVDFDGSDPIAFVFSQNMHRRHLTASQRAAAAVACAKWTPSGSNQHSKGGDEPGSPPRFTNKELAAKAETTVRTIQHAKRAHEGGKGEAVRSGEVSAKAAADSLRPPKDEEEILEKVSDNAGLTALDAQRMEDLVLELEALQRVVDADDKLTAAWDEVKTLSRKYEELERLYESQRRELAEMTREAKRWMKKAQALEKGRAA